MKKQKFILCFIVLCAIVMLSPSVIAASQVTNGIKYVNVTMWDINPLEYNRYARGGQGSSESVDSTRTLEIVASDLPSGGWANRDLGQNHNGQFSAIQGIVGNTLSNGFPTYNYPNSNGIALFPTDGLAASFPSVYPTVLKNYQFPFYKNSEGYYEFDSNTHIVSADHANRRFNLYSGSNIGYTGFFPFNNVSDNLSTFESRNYNFSAYFEIPMYMNSTGLTKNPAGNFVDTVFNFRGDDDIWIFIDNTLILDMGGCHGAVSGSINFRTKTATVSQGARADGSIYCPQVSSFNLSEGNHMIKIFYCERATGESNFKATFNVMPSNLNVKHIDINSGRELASETITDYPGEVKYTSAKNFEGYKVVQKPTSETIVLTEQDQTVYYYYDLIRVNLNINKTIDATASTSVLNLEGARFKVVATSFSGQVPLANPATEYYSTVTDYTGACIVEGLPYGTYTLVEDVIPSKAYSGLFFVNNGTERKSSLQFTINENKTYTYNLNDVPKKMNITVYKEDVETGTITQGDAHLEGAEYTIYRNANCTDAVETITTVKNPDGTYSATSGWYLTGTYYLKETKAPEGYLIDENLYTISQDPAAQTEEYVSHTVKSKDKVKRNDIEIIKNIGKTSNTPQFPLDKCKFTATLVSSIGTDHEFSVECTAETDRNGYCIIEDLPYGTYIVKETKVSPISLRCADFRVFVQNDRTEKTNPYVPKDGTFDAITLGETIGTTKEYDTSYNWLDLGGRIVDVPKVMQIKIRKVDEYATEDNHQYTQGDAVLKGAVYQIYRYDPQTDGYTEYVYDITVDHIDEEGYWCAESDDLLIGKYMVKEKIKDTVTEKDGKEYKYSYAEGYLVDEEEYYFESNPDEQTVRLTYHSDISTEKVIRGRVDAIKYNNNSSSTDKDSAEGAVLRLTLNKNPDVYYEGTIDSKGYVEWVEEKSREKYYPYTIPYGVYTISEVKASNSGKHTFIYNQQTEIKYSTHTQKYIFSDEYVRMRLTMKKADSETGKLIPTGATFKIWNVDTQSWYEEMAYPSGEFVSEFTTNDEGYITLNRHLEAGHYVIYEINAPYGYYLNDDLRIDSRGYEFTVGVEADGVVAVYHNDERVVLNYDMEQYDNMPTKMYKYTAVLDDPPQKAIIKITDIAEQFTKTIAEKSEYGDVNTPIFEEKGLKGVEFDILAAEDIYTPEGTLRYNKGEVVSHIKTDEEGKDETVEIYLGKYEVIQTEVPEGYILDTTPIEVDIEYTNQYERVQIIPLEVKTEKQEVKLSFEKVYKDLEVSKFKFENQVAVFGVYTNGTIKNYKNENTIQKDELVDVIITDTNNRLENNVELPEGSYYVKELYVSNPYAKLNDKFEFEVEYTNTSNNPINVTVNNGKVTNNVKTAELELIAYPDVIFDEYEIGKIKDIERLEELAKEHGISNKTYAIYNDEACTKPVITIDDEEATFVTNDNGIINIPDMPTGIYYFKEIIAPYGYDLSDEVIKAEITETTTKLVLTASEPIKKANLLRKTDAFTKDIIKECVFEILDEEENLIYTGISDKDGIVKVPVIYFENGNTYYYKETSAPDMYEIDETLQEFVAKYNEETCEWTLETIPVENNRKTIDFVKIIKKDSETSELLEGCVFTIVLLDENGEEYVNANGEKIYLVENARTNENGEYIIENVPYGTYRFVEMIAPEGYEIDEDMTGLTFVANDDTKDGIIFEVTNTGDIAVVALVIVAVVCVLGIAFVIVRNKKSNK